MAAGCAPLNLTVEQASREVSIYVASISLFTIWHFSSCMLTTD